MSAPALSTEGLSAGYGAARVLDEVSIEIPAGSIVAVVGPNGAGKTTLAGALVGSVRRFSGDIRLAGESIVDWPIARRARAGIATVPEGRRLFPGLTVDDNLELALFARRRKLSAERRADLLGAAREMFPILGDRGHQAAGSLSGGEQQMLAIARALMLEPKLVVLDEPSTGLAPIYVDRIFEQIGQIVERVGCGCLLIEQRAVTALRVADRAYVLDRGRIAFAGNAADIANDARLRERYLGGPAAHHRASNSGAVTNKVGNNE